MRDPHAVGEGVLGGQGWFLEEGMVPGGRHDSFESGKVGRRRRRDAPQIKGSLPSSPRKIFPTVVCWSGLGQALICSTASFSSQLHTR